jgi:hypothetical protein
MELLAKNFPTKRDYHNKRKELVAQGKEVEFVDTNRTIFKMKTFNLLVKDFGSKREFHAKRKALVAEGYVIQNTTADYVTFLEK